MSKREPKERKEATIVTSQERSLATMVANLRSARVERCQAKMDAMSRIETARSLFMSKTSK